MDGMNDVSDVVVTDSGMGSVWEYVYEEPLILRYGVGLKDDNSRNENNFVKSIRCSPSGNGLIYSSEGGMIEYVNMCNMNPWYMGEELSSVSVEECFVSKEFVHTEVVYGMEW